MDAFWRRAALMAGAFASLAISGPSHGADVTISFSRLSAPGFELGRGQVELATGARDRGGSATPGQLRVFVRKVALGPAFVGLDRLDLRCSLALGTSPAGSGGETSCVDGQVKVLMPNEAFEQSGRFSVSTSARRLRARLKGLGVGEGSVSGTFALDDAGVSKATLSAQGIALKNLLRPGAIGLESVSGKLDVELVRNAGDGNRDEGNLTVRARGVDMSDPQGTFVTEGVAGEVDLKFVRGPKGEYDFNANSHFRGGVVLIDPLVVDFEEDELRGQATGVWSKALRITRARLSHGPNINATL
ncbi:MAG: hypothetical protein K0U93_05865, partial [Gammaproteobacteria bacterium]|nr:hypothetical protein [Gammaproteobacteria bacterium]